MSVGKSFSRFIFFKLEKLKIKKMLQFINFWRIQNPGGLLTFPSTILFNFFFNTILMYSFYENLYIFHLFSNN